VDPKFALASRRKSLKERIASSVNWRVRRYVVGLIQRYVAASVVAPFQSFEQARQLRATFDSMDYADAHMRGAAVFSEKLQVLDRGLQEARTDGLFLEFGVWSGRTINFIAERRSGLVHGFDSFEGLPEDWALHYRKGTFATNGQLPEVRSNVRLHVGWFDQTLPRFVSEHSEAVALLHVDCDLYSSTRTIFELLGDRIASGTVIVFDEYFNYPDWREHEYKAFQEFIHAKGLRYRYVAYNQCQCNVAVVIE
jgi:hypothetical protein